MGIGSTVARAARLRCPVCGQGKLFVGWFRMHRQCDCCGARFEKEPGYFLGSIYVNYGATALIMTGTFFAGYFLLGWSPDAMIWPLTAFCVLFPLFFFRYARSFWMAFDEHWDPSQAAHPEAPPRTEAPVSRN